MSTLPQFRYHPDPVATGSFVASDDPCEVCGAARGWLYDGPMYMEADTAAICPWCIAGGRAHRQLDVVFHDDRTFFGSPVPAAVIEEVCHRTPGFTGWQQEQWWCCCGDAAGFVGRVGAAELAALGDTAIEAVRISTDLAGDNWADFLAVLDRDGSPTAYVFRCLHCAAWGGYTDCD